MIKTLMHYFKAFICLIIYSLILINPNIFKLKIILQHSEK